MYFTGTGTHELVCVCAYFKQIHRIHTERSSHPTSPETPLIINPLFYLYTKGEHTGAHIYISTLRLLPAPTVFLQVRPHFLLIKWLLYQMLLQHQHAGCGYSTCSIELRCKIPPTHTPSSTPSTPTTTTRSRTRSRSKLIAPPGVQADRPTH